MKLANYISGLLSLHDCVIVPNFGGFIANYEPAVIDQANLKIRPPSKGVLFNPNVLNNDGLLGNEIANSEAISYDSALEKIANKVVVWKKELAKGGRVEIGEIGFLYQQNNQIVFEQSREVNLLLSAYGLSEVRFVDLSKVILPQKSIEPEIIPLVNVQPVVAVNETVTTVSFDVDKEAIETIPEHKEEDDHQIIPLKQSNKKWRYLAVAAVIPLMFYTYWIPMETDFIDTGKIQMADFNPIHSNSSRVYETRISNFEAIQQESPETWEDLIANLSDNVTVYNYRFDDELYIPVNLDKTATSIPQEQTVKNDAVQKESNPYHIIAGCFSVESNANNLVNSLTADGYKASVLDKNNGLYRVAMGDFSSREEAKANLNTFKSSGFSGWILKK